MYNRSVEEENIPSSGQKICLRKQFGFFKVIEGNAIGVARCGCVIKYFA
jgi:hypothetical protein